MSRAYRVEAYTKGMATGDLKRVMTKQFGWREQCLFELRGIVCFEGEGWLTGGQPVQEAHDQISKALKALAPGALVSTRWTYMEELPHSDYGDIFDVDTPLDPAHGPEEPGNK